MALPPAQQGLWDQWQQRQSMPPSNTTYGQNTSGRSIVTASPNQRDGYNPYAQVIQARTAADQAGEPFDATQYGMRGGTGFNVKPDDYQPGLIGSNQGNKQFVDMNNDGINDSFNNNFMPPPPGGGATDFPPGYENWSLEDQTRWRISQQGQNDPANATNPDSTQGVNDSVFQAGLDNPNTGMPGPPTQGGTQPPQGGENPPYPPNGTNPQGPYDQWPSAQPSPADYQSVQDYSDQAHSAARRYLDPQQAQQNRRFDQELINRGIDPNSEAGKLAADQLAREQSDANNAASFGALQFGQGIQQQMFGQNFQNRGMDLQQQAQDWAQMMGLEGIDFRNRGYNDSLQMYQDQLLMAMLYGTPIPGGSQTNPYGGNSGGGWNFGWGS